MRLQRRWVIATLAVFALLGAACSDVSSTPTGGETPTGGGTVPDNSDVTISIAVNGWVGSAANANVAANLLQDKLGYTVELVEIDEYGQFQKLATGDLDATLEVWPSGHAQDYADYIESGNGVVDAGLNGVDGQIGWWIPTYMLTDYPELATWEGFKGNESLFATSETGDKGRILDGDPTFVTFDQPIADNLGLDLEVVYAGSEAAQLASLDAAYSNQEPFLFYFWTPHWAQEKYDLTNVELPAVSDACTEAASKKATFDQYACAYPPDPLYKALNEDLATKAPAAFALLSAMSYTNDDQNGIGLDISDGMDGADAAQKWIDANPTVWQPWVDAGLAAG
ncbi:MAG TPA: ABC transporter substrate-binding protein [Actinomycetota bacterium]|jgi:glycine betaine/proline transport system substrate-binding protein|nr:ABC transporter substrate-binding protein [Actinomycetota bacterium]